MALAGLILDRTLIWSQEHRGRGFRHAHGVVVGRHLFVLRPDPERIDAHFLAGILRGSRNLRHYTSMSSSYRVDVRRAEVPQLPIEEQRAYGEAFQSALRRTAELSEEMTRFVTDGLGDGSLRHPQP